MCAAPVNDYKRQLLAASPQFNFSLLQGHNKRHHFHFRNELQQHLLRSGEGGVTLRECKLFSSLIDVPRRDKCLTLLLLQDAHMMHT